MRTTQLLASVALAFVAASCLSGQTGSPDCVPPTNCACDPLYGTGSLLRVHGESLDADGHLVAVVDEVLGGVYWPSERQVGDRIGGVILRELPCGPSYHADSLAGAELFVLHAASDSSPSGLLDGVFGFVIAWADPLDFGDAQHRLPIADIGILETPEGCQQRFPNETAPPCDDTVEAGVCSTARASGSSADAWNSWLFLGALSLGLTLRQRRARRHGVPNGAESG